MKWEQSQTFTLLYSHHCTDMSYNANYPAFHLNGNANGMQMHGMYGPQLTPMPFHGIGSVPQMTPLHQNQFMPGMDFANAANQISAFDQTVAAYKSSANPGQPLPVNSSTVIGNSPKSKASSKATLTGKQAQNAGDNNIDGRGQAHGQSVPSLNMAWPYAPNQKFGFPGYQGNLKLALISGFFCSFSIVTLSTFSRLNAMHGQRKLGIFFCSLGVLFSPWTTFFWGVLKLLALCLFLRDFFILLLFISYLICHSEAYFQIDSFSYSFWCCKVLLFFLFFYSFSILWILWSLSYFLILVEVTEDFQHLLFGKMLGSFFPHALSFTKSGNIWIYFIFQTIASAGFFSFFFLWSICILYLP